ncbi:twin-arginine translocation signal domain-containing protein [Alloacidobacterium dinghuense]|uniref:phospholipase C n=1 Tax=Alloacidobacterium dinghuense TaxID=2763107 RepID=A0A7G8BN15_9BACT|nr:alkaline phosphatase family protein [Alloacidobacterium dinghuense]QNI33935.1 twin-arginine translocation signal domain-containing protein [Alloacidobacterium dinghuense]
MKIQRRDFLRSALGAAAASVLSSCSSTLRSPAGATLPSPESSGIEHIIVVMMENRSFDHFLGWLPNADGKQAGLSYVDQTDATQYTHPLTGDFTGCGHIQPDHSYQGGRIQYNAGKMDGFLRSGNDTFSIGYYQEQDLIFFGAMARQYTTLDRYFCAFMGPTAPNRIFLHAAQTDRIGNTAGVCELETIWDRISDAKVSGRCYSQVLNLWGSEYSDYIYSYEDYLNDAAASQLPAVSFVDAPYSPQMGAVDDHPFADIRNGDAFLSQTYHALVNSPCWPNSVLIVTFDEWGGFFDHVPPPRVAAPNTIDTDLIDGRALLGLRVPTVIVSPFSAGSSLSPRINSTVFDHTSVLKFIEWRWNLQPLTARDASTDIGNLASVLDFANPRIKVPSLPVKLPVAKSPCDDSSGD